MSLRQVALDLRERDVPTVTGACWSTGTIREILLRPRNAGLIVRKGEVLERVEAPWEPILQRDVWDAVRALLTDPSRTKLREARRLWGDDVMTEAEYRIDRAELESRLSAIEERQRVAAGRDPLAGIAGRADAADVWERLDLGRRRAILHGLLVVTCCRSGRAGCRTGSHVDPHSIDIQPAKALL